MQLCAGHRAKLFKTLVYRCLHDNTNLAVLFCLSKAAQPSPECPRATLSSLGCIGGLGSTVLRDLQYTETQTLVFVVASFSNRVHGASKTWRAGAPSSHTNFSWFKTDLRRDAAYTNMPVGKHEREEAYVAAMASELEPEDFVPDTGHHNTATSGQAAKFKRKGRQMDVPSSSKSDESGDEVGGNTVASLGGGTGRLLTLLPMVYWYDSMHVALTDYYNHFVYEKDVRVEINDHNTGGGFVHQIVVLYRC